MKLDFTSVWQYWPFLYHGALLTLKITAICAVLGFLLGIVLALVKISKYKPLIWFGRFYTSIFRGTPLLVQLCIVHFGLPQLLGFTLTTTQSGILTFTLNSAAYVSEIFRGGIMGVDKGQYEAGYASGLTKAQTFFHVIVPQAVRAVIPPLTNDILSLVKGTALVSVIGVSDILTDSINAASAAYSYLEAYVAAALVFWGIGIVLERLSHYVERKFSKSVKTLAG